MNALLIGTIDWNIRILIGSCDLCSVSDDEYAARENRLSYNNGNADGESLKTENVVGSFETDSTSQFSMDTE